MVAPETLRAAHREACRRTDELFKMVRPEALFKRPIPERHRLNFYIGHLAAFDWNMICSYGLAIDPIRADFNELFAFGIDPDESGLPSDQPSDWPGIAETRDYCVRVRAKVEASLGRVPEQLVHVCLEHRLMHAETICYLLHNLDARDKISPGSRAEAPLASDRSGPDREWIPIPAGIASLGRNERSGFGWDNEFGECAFDVPTFEVSKHKVTNGEYLAFVDQGGEAPHYWKRDGNSWRLRTMFGETPLPLDWPVYTTHLQARAFAERAGATLPSEPQWDRAAYGSNHGTDRSQPWGNGEPRPERGNFGFARWDPCAVTATPEGDSFYGVSQPVGNGWEWTSDLFRPFPGFREFPFYPGYSANFFDDEHYVLKGGSPRTAHALLRRSFRNWFREGYPYNYATFRLVRS